MPAGEPGHAPESSDGLAVPSAPAVPSPAAHAERYQAALDASPGSVVLYRTILDDHGRLADAEIIHANAVARSRWFDNLPDEDLVGRRLFAGWPEARADLYETYAWVAEHGQPLRVELDRRSTSGHIGDLLVLPAPGGLLHIARDLTEVRVSLETLRVSEERHRLLAENALDVIWAMAPDGRITYISPSVERLRGFTVAEAMGQSLEEILTPASAAASAAYFMDMLGELAAGRVPAPYRGEQEYRHKDGSTVWCDVMAYPILADDGSLVELLGVSRDLSERRRHEAELRKSERLLADAQRIAHAGSWTFNPRTGTVHWTDELYRIYGLEPGTPAPTYPEQKRRFYSPEAAALLDEGVAGALAGGPAYEIPVEITRADGEVRHVIVRAEAFMGADGAPELIHGTVIDVTGTRRLEARLAEADRLESLGRLSGGIAHMFNNLLMVINGTAELIGASLPDDDPNQAEVAAIRRAGHRAADLTAGLLAFGQRQLLRPVPLLLRPFLAETEPLLAATAGDHVRLVLPDVPDGLGVVADRSRLQQVLMALVANASESMPAGGDVRVAVDQVTIPADTAAAAAGGDARPGTFTRISVQDAGVGIPADVLRSVFEPFYTTKPLALGAGLGLPTAQGIVAQSGGWMEVASEPGVGSVFTVVLPAMPSMVAPAAAPAVTAASAAASAAAVPAGSSTAAATPAVPGPRLLFVEDEPMVRRATGRLLRSLGFDVLEAASGEEALALDDATIGTLGAVVTDVMMPGMDGLTLAERLRARRPDLPILFVSGYAPDDALAVRLALPATGYLAKPFTGDEVARAVREVLGLTA